MTTEDFAMVAGIRRFLAPPVFDDEDKTRVAGLLNTILLGTIGITSLFTVALITSAGVVLPIIGAACSLLESVLWFVMRRGRVRLVSVLFSLIILAGVTGAVYSYGDAHVSIAFGYTICIVAAGILLGNRAALAFTAASVLLLLGLSQAEAAGLLPARKELGDLEFLAGIIAVFGITAVLTGMASRSIREALVRTRRGREEIRKLNEELEQRVVERTAELEDAVKELEAFSYSVSHDLRAPLRAIDGYTRMLVEEHGSSLDAEGRRVCAVVCDETRRMGQLVDGLLTFSRLGRTAIQLGPIDMGTLANSAFDELTTPESRGRIDFHPGLLPPAVGDRTLIRQVWQNLIANAVKFSSKRGRAVIEIGGRQGEGETIYYVRDNGAGFDARYAGKLFGVFERLHSLEEYEGTGVGLAIVQRIIHRHGGQVWAEGEVDKGATFYFALPRKEVGDEQPGCSEDPAGRG